MKEIKKINVKYFDKEMIELSKTQKGDWIDTRVANIYIADNTEDSIKTALKNRLTNKWDEENQMLYFAGDVLIFRLGFAMQLPSNNEAEIKPRSSTFANYGLLLTNSVGCIDESYCGDNDEWLAVFYATRDGVITKHDRVAQFRINEKMPSISFNTVENLNNEDRNGYGSTGVK